MTINEMAVEMNVSSEDLGWWLKSIAAYMQDGLTIEQAVDRVQMIAAADSEADRDDGREPGDTRDEESLEDHNIQGLGAYRDVFDAGGEQ